MSWLERWQDTEPLRLYLHGITVPLLAAALTYGWLTTEQLGAWLAVAGALFLGSSLAGELARRKVASPRTVHCWLEQLHTMSYLRGMQDAGHRSPDELAAATAEMRQARPPERCRNVKSKRRCILDPHGEDTPHHYG